MFTLRTLVSDDGLAHLSRLNQLEDFRLGSPNVKGQGLAFLQDCPRMASIQFVGLTANNSWVQHSGPPPNLTWVQFHKTSIDGKGIVLLGKCTQLKEAYLGNNPIGDEAIDTLAALPLRTLEIDRTNVSVSKLEAIGFGAAKGSKRRYRYPKSSVVN